MNSKKLFSALSALALAACAQTYSPSMGLIEPDEFGEANRQTYAAMVVDPDPVYTEPLTTSGEQASQAIERYRTGEVEEVVTIRTNEIDAGGD